MDIPFVSENFQRSYRNRFPSQVSTGSDLNVSDVVVPIVDFTPTASGTSLPLNLRQSRSTGTSHEEVTSAVTNSTLLANTGFFDVRVNSQLSADNQNGYWEISLYDGSTYTKVAGSYMLLGASTDGVINLNEQFVLFVPNTYTATYSFGEGTGVGALSIYTTQLADVNGNETLPPLYSPQ